MKCPEHHAEFVADPKVLGPLRMFCEDCRISYPHPVPRREAIESMRKAISCLRPLAEDGVEPGFQPHLEGELFLNAILEELEAIKEKLEEK